jgi:hypothetical protein
LPRFRAQPYYPRAAVFARPVSRAPNCISDCTPADAPQAPRHAGARGSALPLNEPVVHLSTPSGNPSLRARLRAPHALCALNPLACGPALRTRTLHAPARCPSAGTARQIAHPSLTSRPRFGCRRWHAVPLSARGRCMRPRGVPAPVQPGRSPIPHSRAALVADAAGPSSGRADNAYLEMLGDSTDMRPGASSPEPPAPSRAVSITYGEQRFVRSLDTLHALIVHDGKDPNGTVWPMPGFDGWWPGVLELLDDEPHLKLTFLGVTIDVRDATEARAGGPHDTMLHILAGFAAAADAEDSAPQSPPRVAQPPAAPPHARRGRPAPPCHYRNTSWLS